MCKLMNNDHNLFSIHCNDLLKFSFFKKNYIILKKEFNIKKPFNLKINAS